MGLEGKHRNEDLNGDDREEQEVGIDKVRDLTSDEVAAVAQVIFFGEGVLVLERKRWIG